MRQPFRIFDQYGTGMVNLLQMRSALQNLGEKLRDEGKKIFLNFNLK